MSCFALVLLAMAQSLLQDGSSPYDPAKTPALKKHDHVQIEFIEKAKAKDAGRPRWDKELRTWTRFDGKEPAATTTITAEVIDVRPNGTLVLQATKRRVINGTQETLKLTGEVASASVERNKAAVEHLANLSVVIESDNP